MDCIIPSCSNHTSSAGLSSLSSSSKSNKIMRNEKNKGAVTKKKNKGKGVMKLSSDPQSMAARERRHRISDRFKILQSMVPGGTKMNTASMLEEAIHYVKFLKTQIWLHQTIINSLNKDNNELSPIMLLPHNQYCFPDEKIMFSLQESNTSVSLDDSMQILPDLPEEQCCFQGVEEDSIFFL